MVGSSILGVLFLEVTLSAKMEPEEARPIAGGVEPPVWGTEQGFLRLGHLWVTWRPPHPAGFWTGIKGIGRVPFPALCGEQPNLPRAPGLR